jgi:hypothetical protein
MDSKASRRGFLASLAVGAFGWLISGKTKSHHPQREDLRPNNVIGSERLISVSTWFYDAEGNCIGVRHEPAGAQPWKYTYG